MTNLGLEENLFTGIVENNEAEVSKKTLDLPETETKILYATGQNELTDLT